MVEHLEYLSTVSCDYRGLASTRCLLASRVDAITVLGR